METVERDSILQPNSYKMVKKKGLSNQKSNRSNYPRNSTISRNLLTVELKGAIKFFCFLKKLVHRNLFFSYKMSS